jgi:hypothetical protein
MLIKVFSVYVALHNISGLEPYGISGCALHHIERGVQGKITTIFNNISCDAIAQEINKRNYVR